MNNALITFGGFIAAMVAAQLLARWLTGLSRGFAVRHGIISPVTARSSHAEPTPRLGGLGLALGFGIAAAGFLMLLLFLPHLTILREGLESGAQIDWQAPSSQIIFGFNAWPAFWIGAGWLGMLLIGLADDCWDLPPLAKLAGMALAALAPVFGAHLPILPFQATWMPTGFYVGLSCTLALLWILFFANAFNFMDGMDGLAAGFARVASLTMFLALVGTGFRYQMLDLLRGEALVPPMLAMACWGFLHWNRPPARVFMGDAGSLSTGYLLAVFALMGQQGSFGLPLPWVVSQTILLPFVFDVVLTLVRRLERGENLLKAHREHLYQRLMRAGLTHAQALRMTMMRIVLCAAIAFVFHILKFGIFYGWVGFALAVCVMIQYWLAVRRVERKAGMTTEG